LDIFKDKLPFFLMLTFSNLTSHPVNLWNRANCWGWDTLTIEVKTEKPSNRNYIIHQKPGVWTRNVPRFDTIPPHGKAVQMLEIKFGNWDIPKDLDFSSSTCQLRVRLAVNDSKEAAQLGVFVGVVVSPWR
jgi:hypothetical protein